MHSLLPNGIAPASPPLHPVGGVSVRGHLSSSSWSGPNQPVTLPSGRTRWLQRRWARNHPGGTWLRQRSCWCVCWPHKTWKPSPSPAEMYKFSVAVSFPPRLTKTYFSNLTHTLAFSSLLTFRMSMLRSFCTIMRKLCATLNRWDIYSKKKGGHSVAGSLQPNNPPQLEIPKTIGVEYQIPGPLWTVWLTAHAAQWGGEAAVRSVGVAGSGGMPAWVRGLPDTVRHLGLWPDLCEEITAPWDVGVTCPPFLLLSKGQ